MHWLLQIHRLAQETTGAANVRPALVNAIRRTPPPERLVPSTFTTSAPSRVLLHVVPALRWLYALWAVLVQID
jgi:hypothetical protein